MHSLSNQIFWKPFVKQRGNKLKNMKYTLHLLFERVRRLFEDGFISSKNGNSRKSWSETVNYITKYVLCI